MVVDDVVCYEQIFKMPKVVWSTRETVEEDIQRSSRSYCFDMVRGDRLESKQ